MKKVLVFAGSAQNAHFLSVIMKHFGINCAEISSKVQKQHGAILNKFKSGDIDVLIATDALARGMDIGQIDFVISYDIPQFVKTYIHRVGRTARAGKEGMAITLLEKREQNKFNTMMKEAGKQKIEELEIEDEEEFDEDAYEEVREKAAESLMKERNDKLDKLPKRNKGKIRRNQRNKK